MLTGLTEMTAPESLVAFLKQLGCRSNLLVEPDRADQSHRQQKHSANSGPFEYLFPRWASQFDHGFHTALCNIDDDEKADKPFFNGNDPFGGPFSIFMITVYTAPAVFFYAFQVSIYGCLMPSLSSVVRDKKTF